MNEFTEFFGLNVLNRTLPENDETADNLNIKLKCESFIYIMSYLNCLKDKYLNKIESLKLEVLENIGKFNDFEIMEDNKKVIDDSIFSNIDITKPINQLEDMINLEFEFSNTEIIEIISKYSILIEFESSELKKLKQEIIELKISKIQLDELYENFGFTKFNEPTEKSISKVVMFMELLEDLFNNCSNNILQLLNDKIENFQTLIDENIQNFQKSCNILKQDIITISLNKDKDEKMKEFNKLRKDLKDLKKLHLFIIFNVKNLESIYQSCGYTIGEFNKCKYLKIINDNKNEWIFINDLIGDSINHLKSVSVQVEDLKKILKIFKFMGTEYINSKDLTTYQTNLLIHKLIRFEYNLKLNPINEIFQKFDKAHKGFLTKSEFQKIFKIIFPIKDYDSNEVDTVFETNYETIGKVRRGMEFKQFKTIIDLSECENDFKDSKVSELFESYKKMGNEDDDIDLRNKMFKDVIVGSKVSVSKIFPNNNVVEWFDGKSEDICIFKDKEEIENVNKHEAERTGNVEKEDEAEDEAEEEEEEEEEEFIEFIKRFEQIDISKIE